MVVTALGTTSCERLTEERLGLAESALGLDAVRRVRDRGPTTGVIPAVVVGAAAGRTDCSMDVDLDMRAFGTNGLPDVGEDGPIVTDKLVKFDSTTATIEESRKENERVLDGFVRIAVVKDVATWVLDLATGATQEEVRERIESIGPSANPIHSHVTRRVRIPPPPERLRRDEPPAGKPK